MKHNGFIDFMGLRLDRRNLTYSQKLLHFYEKNKNIRVGLGLAMGVAMAVNLTLAFPGSEFYFQKRLKEFSASS